MGELHPAGFTDSDGVDIDGWVILPKDYDPSKKYPAILDMHGGPRVAFGGTMFHEMQVFANNGYFVMLCNPRGGDGRGDEFADLREKYGTIDFKDFMEFVDRVCEQYPAIETRPDRCHRRQLRRLDDQLDHRPHGPVRGCRKPEELLPTGSVILAAARSDFPLTSTKTEERRRGRLPRSCGSVLRWLTQTG